MTMYTLNRWAKRPIFVMLIGLIAISCDITKEKTSEKEMIIERSEKWNSLINRESLDSLSDFYASQVLIYGKKKSRQMVLQEKAEYLSSHPSYKQTIHGIQVDSIGKQRYKFSFNKTYSSKGENPNAVQAYLVFVKDGNAWRIEKESDLITEKNLAKRKEREERWEMDREVVATGTLSVERATIPPGTYDYYIVELPSSHKIYYPKGKEAEYLEDFGDGSPPTCSRIQVAQIDTSSNYKHRAYWDSLVGKKVRARGEIYVTFNHHYRAAYGMGIDNPEEQVKVVK